MASDLAERLRARARASRAASEGATPGPWATTTADPLEVNAGIDGDNGPIAVCRVEPACSELEDAAHIAFHDPVQTEQSAKLAEWVSDLIDVDRHTELCRTEAQHYGDGRCGCGWALTLAELAAIVEDADG